jgi:hypothetical protein
MRPAEYSYPGDDEPTRPGVPCEGDRWAILRRLFSNLTDAERRRLLVLADAWFNCDAGERALLEATATRFASRG